MFDPLVTTKLETNGFVDIFANSGTHTSIYDRRVDFAFTFHPRRPLGARCSSGAHRGETVAAVATAHVDLHRSRRSPRTVTTRSESPNGALTMPKRSNPILTPDHLPSARAPARKPRVSNGHRADLSGRPRRS